MILTVEHLTRYSYDRPVRGLVQSHRLTPASFTGQKVLDWQVTVTDGLRGGTFRDGAGDQVESWSVIGPISAVEVKVTGTVETDDQSGVLRGHRECVAPECYLQPTAFTHPDGTIRALAAEVEGLEPLEAAHTLSDLVSKAIVWTPGVTQSQTTASEALAQAQGVCQDHSHALIAAARVLGMPARYISGYMLAEEEQDAAHAWVEIFVKSLGWVGLDAANGCCPDDRYIRLASGLDAQDAAPIRGWARGDGLESLDVAVAVQTAQQ